MVCFWKYTYFQNQKVKGEKLIPKQISEKKECPKTLSIHVLLMLTSMSEETRSQDQRWV